MPRLKATSYLLFLATACVPVTLAAQGMHGAVPGSIQFIQGQANIDGQPLTLDPAANSFRQLHVGESIATANGSVDILLAPGSLLRLGSDTTVRMVAADATRTEVRLEQGIANVSANVIRKNDLVLIDTQQGQTQPLSRGLYSFNVANNTVRVFNGEAYVFPGSDTTSDVKPIKLKEGHELILGGDRAKPASFDRELADNDLLPWSGPKESQIALADSTVRQGSGASYASFGYGGGYGYSGYGLYGAGFGFGDPYFAYGSPYAYGPYGFYGYPFFGVGFYGGGYGYGGGYYGGRSVGRYSLPYRGGTVGGVRGGFAGRGFSGGANRGGMGGGALRGGGGGGAFRGGGGGGHR